jgi:DNA-binding CsgD family transcriptional regulator/PAS domain-containing protein
MGDQDAFERILTSLYDAMLDDSYWPATSTLIDEACGMQGNALLVGEGPKTDIRVHFVGMYSRGERWEDAEREYLEVYHPIDEHVPRLRQLPDSRVVPLTELYTAEELQTSRTYNEFFHRCGAQNGLNVRLDGPAGSYISWVTGDSVTPDGWDSAQLTMIERLLPHIRQFVRVRQTLVSAEALGASVTELLNTPRLGVIYLDQRGRIVVANDRARAILRRDDGLTDRGGLLCARDPADHTRLERLLAGALPTAGVAAVSGSTTVRRAAVLLPFVVHVKPVVGRQPDFGASRVAALVLLVEPGRQPRIAADLVAATLGFTPAESHVAVWLAEGQSLREIARETGRTEAAIRYHLHHMYQKHGLAGQADLIRLVLSLAELR